MPDQERKARLIEFITHSTDEKFLSQIELLMNATTSMNETKELEILITKNVKKSPENLIPHPFSGRTTKAFVKFYRHFIFELGELNLILEKSALKKTEPDFVFLDLRLQVKRLQNVCYEGLLQLENLSTPFLSKN